MSRRVLIRARMPMGKQLFAGRIPVCYVNIRPD